MSDSISCVDICEYVVEKLREAGYAFISRYEDHEAMMEYLKEVYFTRKQQPRNERIAKKTRTAIEKLNNSSNFKWTDDQMERMGAAHQAFTAGDITETQYKKALAIECQEGIP